MANRSKENVKRFAENISKEMAEDAYNGGGGGTEAEFLALKNIFETDFDLVIESDNLDDLIVEVNSYFDTTKVIALGSTLNITAFKNVLQKYLGTLDIDLAEEEFVDLGIVNDNNEFVAIEITNLKNNENIDLTMIECVSCGGTYTLWHEDLQVIPQITNVEDILDNQEVINFLNNGVLTYTGEGVSNGLQIYSALAECDTSNLVIEGKRVNTTDILSMFNAPSANIE